MMDDDLSVNHCAGDMSVHTSPDGGIERSVTYSITKRLLDGKLKSTHGALLFSSTSFMSVLPPRHHGMENSDRPRTES
jgi:hypothetical protein